MLETGFMTERAKGVQWLIAGAAGLAVFLAAQLILHLANLHAWPRHMSSFVYLHWGWLWTVGLVALGTGLFAFSNGLAILLDACPEARWATRSLAISGGAALLMAWFPTDVTDYPSTPSGYIHDLAAVIALDFQCATMFFAVQAGRRDLSWRPARAASAVWPWVASALAIAWGLGDMSSWWRLAALLQRVLAGVMVGWLLVLAWRVRVEALAPASLAAPVQGPQRAR
jgi:hypothetical protein